MRSKRSHVFMTPGSRCLQAQTLQDLGWRTGRACIANWSFSFSQDFPHQKLSPLQRSLQPNNLASMTGGAWPSAYEQTWFLLRVTPLPTYRLSTTLRASGSSANVTSLGGTRSSAGRNLCLVPISRPVFTNPVDLDVKPAIRKGETELPVCTVSFMRSDTKKAGSPR
jgi:hypothetical protein